MLEKIERGEYEESLKKVGKITATPLDIYNKIKDQPRQKFRLSQFQFLKIANAIFFVMMQKMLLEGKAYMLHPNIGVIRLVRYPTKENDIRRMIYRVNKFGIKYNAKSIRYIVKFMWEKPKSLDLSKCDYNIFKFVANRTMARALADLVYNNPSHTLIYHEEQVRKY